MPHLADELKNYYRKSSNKIIFKGGISLNGLSLTMWEKLGCSQIDASVVSRVLKGERLFTYKQLEIFCQLLDCDKKEAAKLKHALIIDLLIRGDHTYFGALPFEYSERQVDEKFLLQTPNIIHSIISSGRPDYAVSLASFFEDFFPNFPKNPKQKWALARLYNEKARAFGLISSPKTIISYISPLNDRAMALGQETKDRSVLMMTYMNIGGGIYVAADYSNSASFLESKIGDVDKNTRVEFLRTLLLDYAHIGNYSKFKQTVGLANGELDQLGSLGILDQNIYVSLIEALSRSFAIFGFIKDAQKILKEARVFRPNPFYESQLLRCKIFLLFCAIKKGDTACRGEFKFALHQASSRKFLPFKRHRQQVYAMAHKLGISYGNN